MVMQCNGDHTISVSELKEDEEEDEITEMNAVTGEHDFTLEGKNSKQSIGEEDLRTMLVNLGDRLNDKELVHVVEQLKLDSERGTDLEEIAFMLDRYLGDSS